MCFVARFQCELNQLNWLLNREKLPCILQVIIVSKGERWPYDKCFVSFFLLGVESTLCLRSTTPLYWTKDHLLIREVLTVDPYSQPKGSRKRAKLREEIALNLSTVSEPRFSISVRSVRDRVNLVLIKKHKRKVAEESKASRIALDEPSEFDAAIEEIWESRGCKERAYHTQCWTKDEIERQHITLSCSEQSTIVCCSLLGWDKLQISCIFKSKHLEGPWQYALVCQSSMVVKTGI